MSECSLWGKIKADSDWGVLGRPFTRLRYTHRAFWFRPEGHADLQRFLAAAGTFYQALAAATNASVIVDSSKNPALAALLTQVPGIEVRVVHMIRDLRGIVASWHRPKAYLSVKSARLSVLHWYWANVAAEFLEHRAAGFSRLRYEDLIGNPKETIEQLASSINGSAVHRSFLRNGQAQIHAQHHVLGNPDKFQCGAILIRERKPVLSSALKYAVSLVGAPLLMRYGYLSGVSPVVLPAGFRIAD